MCTIKMTFYPSNSQFSSPTPTVCLRVYVLMYIITTDDYIVNPLTVRTAIWRFGLISSCSSNRTIILNFNCTFYHPMRLS